MKITVKSKNRDYDVIINNGVLDNIEFYLDITRNYIIVSDDNIPEYIINKFLTKLNIVKTIRFPEGETSKSLSLYSSIINSIINSNITKDVVVLAIGGGVTGDLAGFIASTLYRGVDYIQVPTTLLAQIDSSIGGKVAVNSDKVKNAIGTIYPPKLVLVDPNVLSSLSKRHFNNGMAEMIKYSLISSKSMFCKLLKDDINSLLEDLIIESIKIKKQIVEEDEFDVGVRQTLNFGHTFGHAYEAYYEYKKYLHGEAVALGMLQFVSEKIKSDLIALLKKFSLPIEDQVKKEDLIKFIKNDKKAKMDSINIIKVKSIGEAYIEKIYNYETELLK
ncbi:MAG: 3-dehydroquinate synthase [Candidatus Izemoplasmatales bacterium]|jgi:3-dehydroquinate synthase|nr:3-dehydroquinate synthase [Candidatus Izemoplasmatales bacterium]